MRIRRNVLQVVLVIIMTACNQNNSKVENQLNSVEHFMESRPDTALSILTTIPDPEELTGENQARFALLATQAMHKNYYDLDSDSLIFIALNYYKDRDEVVPKAKAYLYYGKYLKGLGFHEDALKNFQEVILLLENTDEHRLLGMAQEELGSRNLEIKFYGEALENFKESLKSYQKNSEVSSICNAYKNIGMSFTHLGYADSALYYYNRAYEMAPKENYKYKAKLLHNIGVVYRGLGDYEQAEHYVRLSMKEDHGENVYSCNLSLGYIHYLKGEYSYAEPLLLESTKSEKKEKKADAYGILYKLARDRGDYKEAVSYLEKANSLILDYQVQQEEGRNKMVELSRNFLQTRYDKENLKKENQIMLLIIIIGSIIGISAIVGVIFWNRSRTRTLKHKMQMEQALETIEENLKEITRYKGLVFQYEQEKKNNSREVNDLYSRIDLLTEQTNSLQSKMTNQKLFEAFGADSQISAYMSGFLTYYKMVKVSPRYKIEGEEQDNLIAFFDFALNNFVTRLKTESGLKFTGHEIELACLIRIGYSNTDIGKIFNSKSDSVSRGKNRLKSRLEIPAEVSLDNYLKLL